MNSPRLHVQIWKSGAKLEIFCVDIRLCVRDIYKLWLMAVCWWLMANGWWLMADEYWLMANGWWISVKDNCWWLIIIRWWLKADYKWQIADGWWKMDNGWFLIADGRAPTTDGWALMAIGGLLAALNWPLLCLSKGGWAYSVFRQWDTCSNFLLILNSKFVFCKKGNLWLKGTCSQCPKLFLFDVCTILNTITICQASTNIARITPFW